MSKSALMVAFAFLLFLPTVEQAQTQTFPLPHKFPVYIHPMPNGLDSSLRQELEKKAVFGSLADSDQDASLVLALRGTNEIVFEMRDGSRFPTSEIILSKGSLKDIQNGKTAKVAQRIVKEIEKRVNRWMGEDESTLLVKFGPPYQLVPLKDGGKVLVWASEETTTIPGRSYSQGGLQVCGYTASGGGPPPQLATPPPVPMGAPSIPRPPAGPHTQNPPQPTQNSAQPIYCTSPVETVVVPPKEKRYVTYSMFWVSPEGVVYYSATHRDWSRLERIGDALESLGRSLQMMGK